MIDALDVEGRRKSGRLAARHVRRRAVRSRWTLLTRVAVVLALLVAALPAALAASAAGGVSAPGCPDVLLIGARGSGEPESNRGLGPNVGTLYDTLAEDLKTS